MEEKKHTWITGKRLGRVVKEDNRHSVFFSLPRHPGNVLDVMELSDLRRKGRAAAAHYVNEHRQQQRQQQGRIAILHRFAESAIVVQGVAYKGWHIKIEMWEISRDK